MLGLWKFDQDAFRAIHLGLHQDWLDPIFWVISSTGLGWIQGLLVLLYPLLATKKFEKSGGFREVWKTWSEPGYFVLPLMFVIILSGLLASGIGKKIISRDRPSNLLIAHPQETFYSSSFPSGHTTTSFAVAFLLLFVTWRSDRRWLGLVAVLWACLVGFSRVYRGVHWPTDVFGGACLGICTACLTVWLMSIADDSSRQQR